MSLAPLPRRPLPHLHQGTGKDVVWACQGNSLLSFRAMTAPMIMGGPGGPDRVSDIRWLQRFAAEDTSTAWLSAPGVEGVVGFAANVAYAATGGMEIVQEADQIVRLPLAIVELATGMITELTLEVPFAGRPKVPEMNVSRQQIGQSERTRTKM